MNDTTEPQAHTRRLTRSAEDRMVAGVCGGLARATGIDPVIFRVAVAVAVVLGGFGLVAYLVAWVLIPEDDAAESHAETMIRRHSLPRSAAIALGVALAIAALATGPFGDHWGGGGFGLVVLVAVGVWLFNRDGAPAPLPPPPAPTRSMGATTEVPVPPIPPAQAVAPVPPQPPRPAEPASKLPAIVLSTMLLVAGVLALLEVDLDVALAVLLLVLGAGLLVGAWVGRGRSLILLGLPLTVVTAAATAMDVPFAGGAGDRIWRPATIAELEDAYRLGVGEAVLDLSELDLGDRHRRVEVSLALGELTLLLPEEADVELDARTGLGELEAPGFADDGADMRHVAVYEGSGGGSLDLEVRLGIGRLEVIR